jgi:phenylpropionate dioxygenase-like ring-hydroxylating dioxygenase large terminal subunit
MTVSPGGFSVPSQVSSDRYISEAFLEREKRHIFRGSWLVVCPAHKLRRQGAYIVQDEVDESIIAVRDAQGTIRAFHNSCRHRGSRLADGRGRLSKIRCRYHDWNYDLDGRLCSVPRVDGFSSLDTANLNLRPVRTEVLLGFVWINFDNDAPPLQESLAGLVEELAPYQLEDMRAIQTFERVLPCNWKVMLENAMDFYHVAAVHSKTVSKHVEMTPDFHSYGDHSRQRLEIASYGWRERLDAHCSRGGPYSKMQEGALHKYLIFPNFLINVLPYHLTVMQVFPIDAESCRLRYAFCRRKGSRGIELARVMGTWLASRYILREDIDIISRFQQGVSTGRVTEQFFHQEEGAGAHFHGVINRWLATGGS